MLIQGALSNRNPNQERMKWLTTPSLQCIEDPSLRTPQAIPVTFFSSQVILPLWPLVLVICHSINFWLGPHISLIWRLILFSMLLFSFQSPFQITLKCLYISLLGVCLFICQMVKMDPFPPLSPLSVSAPFSVHCGPRLDPKMPKDDP